jgi:hypothetical protein
VSIKELVIKLPDWERPESLTPEQLENLNIAVAWRLGDFDLLDMDLEPMSGWRKNFNDKFHEGDRCGETDYQGWDDEQANARKGRN